MKRTSVLIIGAGSTGLSTAFNLAKKGVKNITIVDKGFVGTGQTGQCCGLVRTFYNSPEMAYMASESMKYIKELCDSSPSLKYETKGLLVINSIQQALVMQKNIEMLKTLGIRARYLDGGEVKKAFPLLETEGVCAGFDEDAGYVNPQKIVNFLAELCKQEGVGISEGTEVIGVERDGAGFRVATSQGEIFTEKLFNATAAYSNSINRFLGVRLEIRAISINNAFYRVPLTFGHTQVAIVDFVNLFYMIPHESFVDVSSVVLDLTREVDPKKHNYDFSPQIVKDYLADISKRIPELRKSSSLGGFNSCIDVTPDYYPILGGIADVPNYYCAAGFSGTGFKHFPMIGKLTAELIIGETPKLLDFFRYDRFAGGKTREGVSDSYFVKKS